MSTLLTPAGDLTDDTAAILRTYVRRFARPRNLDPEELYQEAALCLLERVADYDPSKGAPVTWLFWVCRRAQGRLVRGRRQRPEPLLAEPASATPDPADAAERADAIERLRAAVASLPDPERQLVVRRFGLDGGEPALLRGLLPGRTGEATRQRLVAIADRLRVKLAAGRR
jgi:RNA polymerase sigma-70 factor (ECF subfamily)